MPDPNEITRWLGRMGEGDPEALDRVVRLLYDELRIMARRQLSNERSSHTLSATALVNEVYLKLARHAQINAGDRVQFFAVAATTMRRVLVDYARSRNRKKRGGGQDDVALEEVEAFLTERESEEVLALDAALDRLAALNPRAAKVVEQRFYAGLSVEETASLLNVSKKTIQRDWLAARAWLRKEVSFEIAN